MQESSHNQPWTKGKYWSYVMIQKLAKSQAKVGISGQNAKQNGNTAK